MLDEDDTIGTDRLSRNTVRFGHRVQGGRDQFASHLRDGMEDGFYESMI